MPDAIQMTLRGALSAAVFDEPSALARPTACFSAVAGATSAVRSTALSCAEVVLDALVTLFVAPDFDSWTTRSPPRTGSPPKVRSYRVCVVPSLSWMTSLTTSFSCEPSPSFLAAAEVPALASRISSARCEGESCLASAPGLGCEAEGRPVLRRPVWRWRCRSGLLRRGGLLRLSERRSRWYDG